MEYMKFVEVLTVKAFIGRFSHYWQTFVGTSDDGLEWDFLSPWNLTDSISDYFFLIAQKLTSE